MSNPMKGCATLVTLPLGCALGLALAAAVAALGAPFWGAILVLLIPIGLLRGVMKALGK